MSSVADGATDTYAMTATGTNLWSGVWNLHYSRNTSQQSPDGEYLVDIVDAAGNVGTPTIGLATYSWRVVVDRSAPVVSSYSLTLNGNPVNRFAPAVGSLTIDVSAPTETLSETGIYWVDILDRWNRLIKRLPLTASGTMFEAFWDGTDSTGNLVYSDEYIIVASDYAGNRAAGTTRIFVSTTAFRLLSAAEVTSATVDLRFSVPVLQSSVQNADFSVPGLNVASFSFPETTLLRLELSGGMSHGSTVPITVNVGSITSEDLVAIAAPYNVATITAVDARGPLISSVSLTGLAAQNYFKVTFDEPVTKSSAESASNYSLTKFGQPLTISNLTLGADGVSVTASASEAFAEGVMYVLEVNGVEDKYKNRSTPDLASYTFTGIDVTPPVLTLAVFSNPGNERDIIIAVKSNEALLAPPALTVAPIGGQAVSLAVNSVRTLTWSTGYHIDSYNGLVNITVTAKDNTGNVASKNITFAIATVNADVKTVLACDDGKAIATFERGALKTSALVKMIPHELEETRTSSASVGLIAPKLSSIKRAFTRSSSESAVEIEQALELVPLGDAYEIDFLQSALGNGFDLSIKTASNTPPIGAALFRQGEDGLWQVVSSKRTSNAFVSHSNAPGLFAVLRDVKAPRLSITSNISNEPLKTARPCFEGKVEEYGSGLDCNGLLAKIDGDLVQPLKVLENGKIVFQPIADLPGGEHEIVFEAADLAGNKTVTEAVKFEIKVPLAIGEISIYPNPARVRSTIRISANRRDIEADSIEIHIYDSAGHRVAVLSGAVAARENTGASARYLYDMAWDLTNDDGEPAANGVYFAKIVVHDPDNFGRKIKKTHKIAVLR